MPGWQKHFKAAMDDFKAEFQRTYGKPWTFQNAEQEKEYIDFMREQEKTDDALQIQIGKDNIWSKMGDKFRKISTKNSKKTNSI